jgi:hypothetical protein
MADITMCKGNRCPQREKCYRFNASPDPYLQAYFVDPPYREDAECEMFIEHYLKDKNELK